MFQSVRNDLSCSEPIYGPYTVESPPGSDKARTPMHCWSPNVVTTDRLYGINDMNTVCCHCHSATVTVIFASFKQLITPLGKVKKSHKDHCSLQETMQVNENVSWQDHSYLSPFYGMQIMCFYFLQCL